MKEQGEKQEKRKKSFWHASTILQQWHTCGSTLFWCPLRERDRDTERERERDRDTETEGKKASLFSRKGFFLIYFLMSPNKQVNNTLTHCGKWWLLNRNEPWSESSSNWHVCTTASWHWSRNQTVQCYLMPLTQSLQWSLSINSPPPPHPHQPSQKRQTKWAESLISSTSHTQIWSLIQIKQSLVKCWFYGSPYTFTRNVIYRSTPIHWMRKVIINM